MQIPAKLRLVAIRLEVLAQYHQLKCLHYLSVTYSLVDTSAFQIQKMVLAGFSALGKGGMAQTHGMDGRACGLAPI